MWPRIFCIGGMRAEDAGEDGVDVAELAVQVEGVSQGGGIEIFCDARVSAATRSRKLDSDSQAAMAFSCTAL